MNWLSGVSILPRAQLLGWGVAAVLLSLLVGGGTGYFLGTARGDARVAQLTSDFQKANAEAVAAADADRERKQALADALSAELATTQAELHQAQINLSRRVPYVTTVYLPSLSLGESKIRTQTSAPVAIPRTVFTTGFVRLWDQANGIDLPGSGPAACRLDGEAGTGETVGEGCLHDSGISQADVLTNHIDNALRCRQVEALLDKYIQWHKGSAGAD